ncbi:PE family protein [Mycobacterium terramassiliense]|uniref:PE-PGRS family protein n=1 Tax=Mycobacterium terramassiliense TaxID=1841859 RepID=A0A2U3N6U3_9MYCO|nr:PE family protein [Mycobacterium terramassiliense]SPM27248.1 PE-PGRS family protein [Mycobacterium terramassiliense]
MSFVIATPDLVESAATSLAGIRSSLAEAAATAAGPTTGIAIAAQDEVSVAIASMFGNFGEQFQALSAQAQAFHQQFVSVMNAGAGAYASAEAANAAQTLLGGGVDGGIFGGVEQSLNGAVTALGNGSLGGFVGGQIQTGAQAISNAIAGSPIGLGTLQTGGASALADGIGSFGATVSAPYQALVSNTVTNLQAIGNTVVSNPFPFLHQLVNNQIFYGQTIASSIATGIQNLPAELANLPATIQAALQGLSTINPGALLQQLITSQVANAQTVVTSLQNAAQDFLTGVQSLPAGFGAAFQDLLAGDNVSAYVAINQALTNAFLPGFNGVQVGPDGSSILLDIVPMGPLGDLAPILAIPGQMAQSATNLLPAGTIPAQIAQHVTNLISAFTDFGTTLFIGGVANLNFGIPLQLLLDGIGAPANALSALNSTGAALVGAVQAGNASAAAATLLDAPAVVANAFLNGTTVVALPPATVSLLGLTLPSTTYLPLGGLLTPLATPQVLVDLFGTTLPLELSGGTPIGGLIPGLLSFPAQLAADIAVT